eukprot:TRINITY_DN679_c0_g3_i1.p1 TRINITY_DN679_c0_g3~~TRINITY_DN679_c0_g3_i1.p1  ORF type:complete len:327 (-),score=44.43 TRINITY_DN679_c0_g3_i1:796-1776(-)
MERKFIRESTAPKEYEGSNIYESLNNLRGIESRLRVEDIEFIRREYLLNQSDPDINRLDNMLSSLKSLARFSRPVRRQIIKAAEYFHANTADIVFRQGDIGDHMYIILQGSVNVRIKRKNVYGAVEEITVACLYDGQSFGELALIGSYSEYQKSIEQIMVGVTSVKEAKEYVILKDLLEMEERRKLMEKIAEVEGDRGFYGRRPSKIPSSRRSSQAAPDSAEKGPVAPMRRYADLGVSGHRFAEEHASEKSTLMLKESNHLDSLKNPNEQKQPEANQQRRTATIECAEECHFLRITKERYKEIILTILLEEIEDKLETLMTLPFFM